MMWAAILNNLPAILQALGTLITVCISAYTAIKAAKTHTTVTNFTNSQTPNNGER